MRSRWALIAAVALGLAGVGAHAAEEKPVRFASFRSEKIRYEPGDRALLNVVIENTSKRRFSGRLEVTVTRDLAERRTIRKETVTVRAGRKLALPVSFPVADADHGRGATARLHGAEKGAGVVDEARTVFTVGHNAYELGNNALIRPWTWSGERDVFPKIEPRERVTEWIPKARRAGATSVEYFFWAPDDFGNLTPERERWFSGQASYLVSVDDIRAIITAAHRHGIAAITYGKDTGSIAGAHAGEDAFSLIRRHPKWVEYMPEGRPKWWWAVDRYLYGFDEIHREWIENTLQGERYKGMGNKWWGAGFNFERTEVVDYGAAEILRSAKRFGWDGVRFDDHFTMEPRFDGGVGFDGKMAVGKRSFDKMSARNTKRFEKRIRAERPNFLVGYNYAARYQNRALRMPTEYREACDEGDFVMIEWSVWWHKWQWRSIYEALAEESRRVRENGGVPGFTKIKKLSAPARRIESAMAFATATHHYNLPRNPAHTQARFALRYSRLLFDVASLEDVEAPEKQVAVAPAPDGLLWRETVYRQNGPAGPRLIVHLLNAPSGKGDAGATTEMPKPIEDVTVTLKGASPADLRGAIGLAPDARRTTPVRPQALAVRDGDGGATVTVPEVHPWSIVVFQLPTP